MHGPRDRHTHISCSAATLQLTFSMSFFYLKTLDIGLINALFFFIRPFIFICNLKNFPKVELQTNKPLLHNLWIEVLDVL